MKTCLIIYYSYHHGNTEKIANSMAEISHAKICTIDKIDTVNLQEYDIIGFGAGIAYGKHYDKLLQAVKRIQLQGKNVFVFSTSGMGNVKYNASLIELLKNAGAAVVGSFACKGFDTYGPFKLVGGVAKGHPNNDDFAAAKQFIQKIVS